MRLGPALDEPPATLPDFEHIMVVARRLQPVPIGQLSQDVRIDVRVGSGAPSARSTEMLAVQCVMTGRKVSSRVRQFPSGGLYEGLL